MIRWTKAELAKLRRLYPVTATRKLAALLGRPYQSVKAAAANRGITKAAYRPWKRADEQRLRRLYPDMLTAKIARLFDRSLMNIYRKAAHMGLAKSAAFMASPAACRLRRGDKVGASYRFPKGHVPANKGLRRPGYAPGRMAQTQFKKGNQANPAKARRPIGTERVSTDGYLERKITDKGRGARRWRGVHILLWEEKNGPLPPGHMISFRDGNKKNIVYKNLELLTHAERMRRNTFHRYPKDIALAIIARGHLTRQINKLTKSHSIEGNGVNGTRAAA